MSYCNSCQKSDFTVEKFFGQLQIIALAIIATNILMIIIYKCNPKDPKIYQTQFRQNEKSFKKKINLSNKYR